MKIQPKVRGVTRKVKSTRLLPSLSSMLRAEARRFNVSESFVLATAFSFVAGDKRQPQYRLHEVKRRKRA